mgnify:CR=1 FL=1
MGRGDRRSAVHSGSIRRNGRRFEGQDGRSDFALTQHREADRALVADLVVTDAIALVARRTTTLADVVLVADDVFVEDRPSPHIRVLVLDVICGRHFRPPDMVRERDRQLVGLAGHGAPSRNSGKSG